ncbi:hypothetical protein KA005_79425 [bacterium]|nr:hypothetical protein [bacterium]
MQAISPKLGEFLVKATRSKDIDDAFHRVFSDYLALKIASLAKTSENFKRKWGMDSFGIWVINNGWVDDWMIRMKNLGLTK